jgi:predicted kinase
MLLIAMMGLPGSGKSALARQIAPVLPAVILDKDTVRAALFPPSEIEYTVQQDDFVVQIMLQVAAYLLAKGRNVILDGRPFSRCYQVQVVVDFASQAGFPLKVIECVCSDASIQQRLEAGVASGQHHVPGDEGQSRPSHRPPAGGRYRPTAGRLHLRLSAISSGNLKLVKALEPLKRSGLLFPGYLEAVEKLAQALHPTAGLYRPDRRAVVGSAPGKFGCP